MRSTAPTPGYSVGLNRAARLRARRISGRVECIAEAIRDVTKLRGEVDVVPPGSLPNDGRMIEDARDYT